MDAPPFPDPITVDPTWHNSMPSGRGRPSHRSTVGANPSQSRVKLGLFAFSAPGPTGAGHEAAFGRPEPGGQHKLVWPTRLDSDCRRRGGAVSHWNLGSIAICGIEEMRDAISKLERSSIKIIQCAQQ